MHVYTVEQMRALERAANEAGHSYAMMMERAGRAVAGAIQQRLGDLADARRRVVVLVGPGNNGGDGLVAARELARQRWSVAAFLWQRERDDPLVAAARGAGVALLWADEGGERRLPQALSQAGVVVDALFGTGLSRPIEGEPAAILEALRAARLRPRPGPDPLHWVAALPDPAAPRPYLVAVDIPSGVNGQSGARDEATVPADLTVTFAGAKVGMLAPDAVAMLGELVVADIGIPPSVQAGAESEATLLSPARIAATLPARPASGHKGTFGTTLIVGGSMNYVGAPALSALAAGRSGAGLVTVAVPAPLQPLLAARPDLTSATWLLLPHDMGVLREEAVGVVSETIGRVDALVLGPGLGGEERSRRFVWSLLELGEQERRVGIGFAPSGRAGRALPAPRRVLPPTVVDADGLNALAAWDGAWWEALAATLVLTPHPAEMGRLLGREAAEVQGDRLGTAWEAARRFGQVVVLKGAYTVIAAPDGRCSVAPFANDALAKAGSGDILAGVIGALLAQGMAPYDAACAGVLAHGLAGERLARAMGGQGALSSDLLDQLPAVWQGLRALR